MKVYYSHPKIERGSEQERTDIEVMEQRGGYEVTNPYDPIYRDCWETEGIEFGKVLIDMNDAVAFRAMDDDKISSGVGKELKWAIEMGKDIIELPLLSVCTDFKLDGRVLSFEETIKRFYG